MLENLIVHLYRLGFRSVPELIPYSFSEMIVLRTTGLYSIW